MEPDFSIDCTLTIPPTGSLLSDLATVPDPRSRPGRRHRLSAMPAAVRCAILRGARGFKPIAQRVHDRGIALVHAPGLTRTPPKRGASRKPLSALGPAAFEDALSRWAEAASAGPSAGAPKREGLEAVGLDGQSSRGSIAGHGRAVHSLSAMAQRRGLTSRRAAVGAETNERQAALELLRGLASGGRVNPGDPMSRQRDPRGQVIADGGHHLVGVKDDPPGPRRDISDAFTRAADAALPPSPACSHPAATPWASDTGSIRRPNRVAPTSGDRPGERVPRLAGGGPGRRGPTDHHPSRRGDRPGVGRCHHRRAGGRGGRGDPAESVAWTSGDRGSPP